MEEAFAFLFYGVVHFIFAYLWRVITIGLGIWIITIGWNSADYSYVVVGIIMIAMAVGTLWGRLRAIWKS